MAWKLNKILHGARALGASDVHLVRGLAPVLRINGEIQVSNGEPLNEELLRSLLDEATTPEQRAQFEQKWQLCQSRHWEGIGRCRVTAYYHSGCP
ncbi:MAG: hypothetical protein GX621_10005, partial [Pirellulaceae bacterium]|nr:hypothetical protein [Pirellulaceae bacterium]